MSVSSEEDVKHRFMDLVTPHKDVLLAGALRLCNNNRPDAEDLLQETFMKAYTAFRRSQEIENPRAWLFKIMRNAFINRYHKSHREPAVVSYDEALDDRIRAIVAHVAEDPEKVFFSRFLDSEVEEAFNSLPEQFKEAVTLCDISGLSYEEISETLNVPLGTVRSRISRGREMLFGKLYEYAKERGLLPRGEKGRQG